MGMDDLTKRTLQRWAPVLVLFLAIACTCLGFIFAPIEETIVIEDYTGGQQVLTHASPAISMGGLLGRVESWKKYPEYNIGLGIAAGLSFVGALWVIARMYEEAKEEEEEP